MSAAEIDRQLVDVYGDNVMSRQSMETRYAHFSAERIITDDCERSGRHTATSTPGKKTRVENAVLETEILMSVNSNTT